MSPLTPRPSGYSSLCANKTPVQDPFLNRYSAVSRGNRWGTNVAMADETQMTDKSATTAMSVAPVERETRASCDQVWAVIADGWTYASWVVGTARIRAVEAGFPAAGSAIHHSFGAWPAMLHDRTVVCESEPNRRLVLEARGWPLGQAHVEIVLSPNASGCTISMAEDAEAGPGKWLTAEPVRQALIRARNKEGLRRLALLAEKSDQAD